VNVGSNKQVTEFVSDKRFGLIYKDQWRLASNTTIREQKNHLTLSSQPTTGLLLAALVQAMAWSNDDCLHCVDKRYIAWHFII
jgi:hypothetical protein